VSVPDADALILTFDERCNSEAGYDFLAFFADEECTQRLDGTNEKYAGDEWPGKGSKPPLRLKTSKFWFKWVTDGSGVSWGWKMTVTPDVDVKVDAHPLSAGDKLTHIFGEPADPDAGVETLTAQVALAVAKSKTKSKEAGGDKETGKPADELTFCRATVKAHAIAMAEARQQRWRVRVVEGPGAPLVIGIGRRGMALEQRPGDGAGSDGLSGVGWGGGVVTACGRSAPFGPALRAGDVVSVSLDELLGTVSFDVNGTRVGVALGPMGVGAALAIPLSAALGENPNEWRPAVALGQPPACVELLLLDGGAAADGATAASEPLARQQDEPPPPWLADVVATEALLRGLEDATATGGGGGDVGDDDAAAATVRWQAAGDEALASWLDTVAQKSEADANAAPWPKIAPNDDQLTARPALRRLIDDSAAQPARPSRPREGATVIAGHGAAPTIEAVRGSWAGEGTPFARSVLEEGVPHYTDRDCTLSKLPKMLVGAHLFRCPCHAQTDLCIKVSARDTTLFVLVAYGNVDEYGPDVAKTSLKLPELGFELIAEVDDMATGSFNRAGYDIWALQVRGKTTIELTTSEDCEFNLAASSRLMQQTATTATGSDDAGEGEAKTATDVAALELYSAINSVLNAKFESGEFTTSAEATGYANKIVAVFAAACEAAGNDDFPRVFAAKAEFGNVPDVAAAALELYSVINSTIMVKFKSGEFASEAEATGYANKIVAAFAAACEAADDDNFPKVFKAKLQPGEVTMVDERLALIRRLNTLVDAVLPFVSLADVGESPTSLAALIARHRTLILMQKKKKILDEVGLL
jgi:hypothetical protein